MYYGPYADRIGALKHQRTKFPYKFCTFGIYAAYNFLLGFGTERSVQMKQQEEERFLVADR